MNLVDMTAAEAGRAIAAGEVSSEGLVQACLAQIDAREDQVGAWVHLDRDHALDQARRADDAHRAGITGGPLHGVPIGIKDIYDTGDMPTENGTPLDSGRRPKEDATAVALLREAGAVILGKTVTTELAVYTPGKTRNPHDPARTPGGSSSGSAAAVAARMVPAALGSQTNGSVIRPAAYCGVYGFKPSHGRISRHGVLALSRPLDTLGVFARSIEDLALLGDCLMAYDSRDPDMRPVSRPDLASTAMEDPPVAPSFAFVKSPVWEQADEDTQGAFAELADFLGENCDEVALPEAFANGIELHRTVMLADMAKNLDLLYRRGKDQLSDRLRQMIEDGQRILAIDYNAALDWIGVLNAGLEKIFERYDAILTPAATGEASIGLDSTGSPAFCSLWTLCGVPSVNLPLMHGSNGLPIGVQLVAGRGDDGRLLRTARALAARAEAEA